MQAPIFMPRGAPNGAWSLPETACGNVLFAGGARFREEDFRAVRIADRRIQIKQVPARRGRVAVLPSRAAQGIPAPPGRHDLTYIARAARLRRNRTESQTESQTESKQPAFLAHNIVASPRPQRLPQSRRMSTSAPSERLSGTYSSLPFDPYLSKLNVPPKQRPICDGGHRCSSSVLQPGCRENSGCVQWQTIR
jgi:hypothetical protein